MSLAAPLRLHDAGPSLRQFRDEVLTGLLSPEKTLPCKYFYDEIGSRLFDRICDLDEYYPTRTETAIMRANASEMADCLGRGRLLIEYGSGSSRKTRVLLDHLREPAGYVPIDISREHLMRSAAALAEAYPGLRVMPVCADYTERFDLPEPEAPPAGKAVYFPGSTIGNFNPGDSVRFMARIAEVCGEGGGLLIGVDLKKEIGILEPAYNDRLGVTAAFNLNLLHRINRELDADFQVDAFHHHAFYNPAFGRIEMHLVSRRRQTSLLGGVEIRFDAGETVRTECSYKYNLDEFACLAARAGFAVERVWTDLHRLFSVQYLVADRSGH